MSLTFTGDGGGTWLYLSGHVFPIYRERLLATAHAYQQEAARRGQLPPAPMDLAAPGSPETPPAYARYAVSVVRRPGRRTAVRIHVWLLALICGVMLLGVVSNAQPLSVRTAQKAIARDLRDNFRYGYQSGSLVAPCTIRTSRTVHCDILFADDGGDERLD